MKKYYKSYKPLSIRRTERKAKNRLILSIIIITLFGYLLIFWILPYLIGSLSILNKFKGNNVPREVVEDTTIAPPVLNIPYEATNTATIKVKGYSQPNSKIEIYIDEELKDTVNTDSEGQFLTSDLELNLGNNSFSGKTVDDKGNNSLSSKVIRIFYDRERPKLEVVSPSDNQEFKGDRKINVSGSVETEDNLSVSINNFRVIVDGEGNFSQSIELSDGENNIVVIASDNAGNTTTTSRKVLFTP